jgi:hypothetical protein
MTMTGGNPLYYAARAWVKFNGGTGAIFAGANVASVNVDATGTYTITFTTPMPDTNYAVIGSCRDTGAGSRGIMLDISPTVAPTASAVRVRTLKVDTDPGTKDATEVYVAVFR